ncbi:MAG: response regulator transcription factor [Candidatus Marinimicrobia bacterium]|nr:response regulator transcription factor [Candidatus Neomarinimicrobiota bacterium]
MAAENVKVPEGKEEIRILLVDDHAIMLEGLTLLIQNEPDMIVCGEAEDLPGAMGEIPKCKPDLALIDISLKDSSGIELIRKIKKKFPGLLTIALSMHDELLIAERALHAGAHGYIMKRVGIRKVIEAIREVLKGNVYISQELREYVLKSYARHQGLPKHSLVGMLSDREFEVIQLIGIGYRPREIASQLELSPKTIETYRYRIRQKLGLANTFELIHFAIQWVKIETLI